MIVELKCRSRGTKIVWKCDNGAITSAKAFAAVCGGSQYLTIGLTKPLETTAILNWLETLKESPHGRAYVNVDYGNLEDAISAIERGETEHFEIPWGLKVSGE